MDFTLKCHIRNGDIYDISELVEKVTWSGDYKSPSRTVEFSIAQSAIDVNLKTFNIPLGSTICFYVEGKEVYRGTVLDSSKDTSGNSIDFTSKDLGFLLTQSDVFYNFKDVLVEDIAKQVLQDNMVAIGTLAKTGVKHTKMYVPATGYDVIMSAYTDASKTTKKKYMVEFNLDKFDVIEKGTVNLDLEFQEGQNIINTSFSESMENVKNKVVVIDKLGNKISEKTNEESVKQLGVVLQKVIQQQENSETDVDSEFKDIEKTCSLKGYGDPTCITGRGVKVKDTYTGLVGLFYIDSDKHTFSNGDYSIELGLNFENIMDKKTAGQDEPQEDTNDGDLNGGEYPAEFTAYYPSNDPMQGGFEQAMDSKPLVPANMTCAAPKDVPFKTKIQVKGTGTDRDGKSYTVTDRGGAIVIKNGVYHIDLLMANRKEAYSFGRRKGTVVIGNGTGYASDKAKKVIEEAKKHLGKPYKWGAVGPSTFDCSGLMQYCFKKALGIQLPRVSRSQATVGTAVSKANLQPGDLVFFGVPKISDIHHVGLYVGNGEYLHAPQTGDKVKISKMSSRGKNDFNRGRRLF